MWWINLVLVIVYVGIAIFSWWSDQRLYKSMSSTRVAYNPQTGKYAYSYQDKSGEQWIDQPH